MTKRDLPSPELLRKLLRYEPDTGKLFWRKRTPDMFSHGKRGYTRERSCSWWNTRFANKEAFTAVSSDGYPSGLIFGRKFYAHRVIWGIHCGILPSGEIDHINGDPSDNRIENLRNVSHRENGRNRRMQSNNTSGAVGVSWYKPYKKWVAQVNDDKGRKTIGYFDKKSDAIAAVISARAELGYHRNHGRS